MSEDLISGSFIAKVKGPGGWFVSPSKVNVECGGDGCAQGKDVNFEVVGFSLRGKIEGADIDGCTDAPSNFDSVTVVLRSEGMCELELVRSPVPNTHLN